MAAGIGILGIMGEHAKVDVTAIFPLERIVKQEIGVGRHVLLFQTDNHSLLPMALDLGFVGRRIDRLDLGAGSLDLDLHGKVLNRAGRVFLGIEVVEVAYHLAVTLKNLGVFDLHFLFLLRLDGKDANLEEALPGILE